MAQNNQTPLVIKLGGAVLSCSNTLNQLFATIAAYQKSAQRKMVILHGGGYLVDELMGKLQLETIKKNGLRVTPYDHIPIITGALAGTANKLLQGRAIANGLKTVGLCLADGNLCLVEELNPELGAVGKALPNDPSLLQAVLNNNALPIINSIGLTEQGQMMNVNADQAAVAVAGALDADLVLLSDVQGVLNEKRELITKLSATEADALIAAEVITDGMIVKVKAALQAANFLGRPIQIATWRYPDKLSKLFAGENIGTEFLPQHHQNQANK